MFRYPSLPSSLFIFFFAVFTASLSGQEKGNAGLYFPLAIGNRWIYTGIRADTTILSDTASVGGKLYFKAVDGSGYNREWYRESGDSLFIVGGSLPDRNDTLRNETLLYLFTDDPGIAWDLPLGYGCTYGDSIRFAGIDDTVSTPAGYFADCYRFQHITGCRDAGMMESWFAPGIGKVRWTQESIFGMQTFVLTSFSLSTGIDNHPADGSVPVSYLIGSYPNPFNPVTTIRYRVAGRAHVTLRVLDGLGREVSVLVNGYKQAGLYDAVWNAGALPSGVYYADLRVSMHATSLKLVLLR